MKKYIVILFIISLFVGMFSVKCYSENFKECEQECWDTSCGSNYDNDMEIHYYIRWDDYYACKKRCPDENSEMSQSHEKKEDKYSSFSYSQANSSVGCDSKFSEDRKKDIFNKYYKDHYLEWRGEIVYVESGKISLNIDGKGLADLSVSFADKNAGYYLNKGDFITVRFLMESAGGCFLPFYGEDATIIR